LLIDPDAPGAVQRLRDLGFAIVIVTNQPDVARGTTTARIVEAINERVATAIRADGVYTCFHDRQDDCECRKPRPGMLLTAAAKHRLELGRSYMVGDRWSDIAAGRDARCRTVWIERGYDEQAPTNPDARCSSLLNACNWIIDDFTK
jgi:D-glycero-D-manno-heptose 1,7-bisphosphate phosphatase